MSDRSRWTIPALLCVLAAAPAVLVALLGKHDGHAAAGRALRRRRSPAPGIAAVAAAALTRAGRRAVDGRAMLLGTAFSTMTALLAVHGHGHARAC